MSGLGEALDAKGPLASDLAVGVEAISSNQTIEFTKYVRVVLPLDGYVFWVKADLLSPSALANAALGNQVSPNDPQVVVTPAATFDAPGSLHVVREDRQNADSNYAVNTVTFTSEGPINEFDEVGLNVLWIGEFEGVRFAFSRRKSFYQQAGLWHYVGDAVYSIMETQLIDSVDGFDAALIVSNSLPIWLSMNDYPKTDWEPFINPIKLFPAYLVDENLAPPFGAVDVIADSTVAIASAPTLGPRLEHMQLARERVRITLWGLSNSAVMEFVDFVNQFSLNNENTIGLANSPVPKDPKTTQVELGTIAKKKIIEYEVNYAQFAARDLARQLILRAIPTFIFN